MSAACFDPQAKRDSCFMCKWRVALILSGVVITTRAWFNFSFNRPAGEQCSTLPPQSTLLSPSVSFLFVHVHGLGLSSSITHNLFVTLLI